MAVLLRPCNAGSNTATVHIAVARDALAQLPGSNATRPGKKVLIRAAVPAAPRTSRPGWTGTGASTPSASPCPLTLPTCCARSPSECGPRPTTQRVPMLVGLTD